MSRWYDIEYRPDTDNSKLMGKYHKLGDRANTNIFLELRGHWDTSTEYWRKENL